jgi:sugar phosphate isomerase/epimerase
MKPILWILSAMLVVVLMINASLHAQGNGPTGLELFDQENLVAWCIVPFDAEKRGPEERAEMLERLGLERVAYDWRQEHVATFEEEILAYEEHNLEFFAFWGWHDDIGPLIEKYGIRPQFWQTVPSPASGTQEEKVEAAARSLIPLVERADELGCQVGLYNHGGWGGEPENMAAVARWLHENAQADHVGIVYNLHHGHGRINDFADVIDILTPYLLCLNLNGMNDGDPKILPIGEGTHDRTLLEIIATSKYSGPIGILDHRGELDTEESLRQNLEGLRRLVKEMRL